MKFRQPNALTQQTAFQVQQQIDDSHRVLRSYRIDATHRMSFAVAAEAAGVTTDELLAVLDDRMRRAARRAASTHALAHVDAYEEALI